MYRDSLGNRYTSVPPAKHPPKQRGSKKGKKIGRNKVKCARYRSEGRREKNKARRAARRNRDGILDQQARR